MEEDIIFGKNRHLYGGLEPSNMVTLKTIEKGNSVHIYAELPKDTVVNGQTLVTVAGAVIRKSENEYPKDEFDGELVADIAEDGIYLDETNSSDRVWYYSAFPYSDQGVYNRSELNRCAYDPFNYIYGYDLDLNDPDPSTRVTYPNDVDNAGEFTPIDGSTPGAFDYGDWAFAPGQKFMPKPCMLRYDGTVEHYLNPNDYSLQENSTLGSRVADTSFEGSAMMEWPKIYTKRWEENGIYHFRCSNTKRGSDWECFSNCRSDRSIADHFYTSIYPVTIGYSGSGVYHRSLSTKGAPITGKNYDSWTNTLYVGSGWKIDRIHNRFLIQDLLVMMAKSTDTQSKYGQGYIGYTNASNPIALGACGQMDTIGMFGQSSYGVKVFGMEHFWGSVARMQDDIRVTSSGIEVDYPDGGVWWKISTSSMKMGYIAMNNVQQFGRLPSLTTGSATTYECDYSSISTPSSSYVYVIVCGRSSDYNLTDSKDSGAFEIYGNLRTTATNAYVSTGLSYV